MRSVSVIKENRGYVGFAFCLFVLGVLMGFAFQELLDEFMRKGMERISKLAAESKGSHLHLAMLLFANNVTVSMVILLSGVFFSVLSIYFIVMNGMLVGYALAFMGKMGQVPVWALALFGILPHGILEIPAFLLSGAMGIKLGYMWLRPLAGKTRWRSFLHAFGEAARAVPVIVLLLLAAAMIEGFVTPGLLMWYMR